MITAINPLLKSVINKFDVDCEKDASLLINSLRRFLREDVHLCESCAVLDYRVANPLYQIAARLMRLDPKFMRGQFLDQKYGNAWLKGFALMMKGIEKYGIRATFTPAGPFEIVWNFTYSCNLKCKHCYENAGYYRIELTSDEAFAAIDGLSKIANVGSSCAVIFGRRTPYKKRF